MSKLSGNTGTEQASLQSRKNSEHSHKSNKEVIKIEIHTEQNKDQNIICTSFTEKQNIVNNIAHSVESNTLQPMIFINNNSVSQNSKTEHKLNDIMDEVLCQSTPTTHRSSNASNRNTKTVTIAKNINNIVSPPPKSTHYMSHTTTTADIVMASNIIDPQGFHTNTNSSDTATAAQTGRPSISHLNHSARSSVSDHRVATTQNTALPRNDSIPMPSMGAQIFNKTQRKSMSPSASMYNGSRENKQQIEKIIIPRMGMAIGQSVRSPAVYSKEEETTTNHESTTTNATTDLNKYMVDEDMTVYNEMNLINLKKDSTTMVHQNGQSSPTLGSRFSQNTGITSFQPDNLNHNSSIVHDGIDSIQLTLYDLDEDEDKKLLSYPDIYDTNNNQLQNDHSNDKYMMNANGLNTHSTQRHRHIYPGMHNNAMKNMMNAAIDFADRPSDDYHATHKGIRIEMQDSASFQSSILPLPVWCLYLYLYLCLKSFFLC